MRYCFIEAEKANYPIKLMCKVLMVSTSGYYSWRNRPESNRHVENEALVQKIREIHKESRQTYGSPRIYDRLKAERYMASENRVARLMRQHAIRACYKRKYVVTTDSQHSYEVAPNLLRREFNVGGPNKVWVSDITYVPTDEGWLYLGATMDLFARRIVGWSMLEQLRSALACGSLDMALSRREVDGELIHHSDRGIQYASDEYQLKLKAHGIKCSMSRKGDCWDNAPMESFFKTLKVECVYRRRFRTRQEAKTTIFEYIEVFYNRKRHHSYLDYKTPAEYEDVALAS